MVFNSLEGRVAVVTGAGNGLGRAHALHLAQQGARVVVNDLGGSVHGEGSDAAPAHRVTDEIRAFGAVAVASTHDVADWNQARELIQFALTSFGDLHVLVNNAGIVRDRTLVNMTEEEWDAVVRVHLKGHAAPTKFAMAYWREESKRHGPVKASVIHTSSVSGLAGIYGQANYAAAKLGIVGFSRIVSLEGAAHGVRSNVISPAARTRISKTVPAASTDPSGNIEFDHLDPAHVSPLVAWLATEDCPADSQIFHVGGRRIVILKLTEVVHEVSSEHEWTPDSLDVALRGHLIEPTRIEAILGRPPVGTS